MAASLTFTIDATHNGMKHIDVTYLKAGVPILAERIHVEPLLSELDDRDLDTLVKRVREWLPIMMMLLRNKDATTQRTYAQIKSIMESQEFWL